MTARSHCTFCDLIQGAGEVSTCYEDADAVAFMDIQPVNPGHVLVVPREHHESMFDVPAELGDHIFRVTMRLASAVRRVTGCEDVNIIVSSGEAAGQDVFHHHVHIIPRRAGDGFEVQLPFDGSEMPDRTMLDAIAARIISAMRDPMRPAGARGGTLPAGDKRRERVETVDDPHPPAADAGPVATEREVAVAWASEGPQQPKKSKLYDSEGPHGELVRVDIDAPR